MVWKGGSNRPRKSLFRKFLARAVTRCAILVKAMRGQWKYTDMSSDQHFLGELLHVPLIGMVCPTFAERGDISQV